MSTTTGLKVGSVDLPTPKDVKYSFNKLWSQNTGRLDSGYFVGDLIGIKKKYEVTFPALSATDEATVRSAINTDFAAVEIKNAEGGTDSINAYFGDLNVQAYSWNNGIRYAVNATVSIIER